MSDLQTAVSNLQDKHGELVDAVRNASGSRTVAGETNDAMGEALVAGRGVKDSASRLRKRIEDDGQSLILDWEHDVAVVNGEGKPFNEVVTFSRATGGGRIGPDGKYEWIPATRTNMIARSQGHRWINGQTGTAADVSLVTNTDPLTLSDIPEMVRYVGTITYGLFESIGGHVVGDTYTVSLRLKTDVTLNTPAVINGSIISSSGYPITPSDGFKTVTITYVATNANCYPAFTGGRVWDFIYFQRETGTKASDYIPTFGSPVTVPNTIPRIDYDPETGECLGLLVEEQRTNLFASSSGVRWINGQTGTHAGQSLIPNTDSLTVAQIPQVTRYDGLGGKFSVFHSHAHVVDEVYTLTVRLKVSIDLASMSVVNGSAVRSTGFPILATDGYKTVTFTYKANTATCYPMFNGGRITDFVYFQMEKGTFPTSYIPTKGAQVTRAADNAVIDLSDKFNPDEGTFFFEFKAYVGGGEHQYVNFNNTFRFYEGRTPGRVSVNWGLEEIIIRSGVSPGFYSFRIALTYTGQQTQLAFLFGDEVLVYSTRTAFQIDNTLYLFNRPEGDRSADGIFKTVEYYPKPVTEEELIRMVGGVHE